MVRPVVDGAFVVCFATDDIFTVSVVVEDLGGYPGELRSL